MLVHAAADCRWLSFAKVLQYVRGSYKGGSAERRRFARSDNRIINYHKVGADSRLPRLTALIYAATIS